MKQVVAVFAFLSGSIGFAQNTWLPLSREVERPYATAAQQYRSDFHTAIRPYRMSELTALNGKDSLNSTALLPALDRWAGVRNGRSFRWGPLLDAQAMLSADSASTVVGQRVGAGLWTVKEFSPKLSFGLNAQVWNERFPTYLDTLVRAMQVTPGEGYGYGKAPNFTHYDWQGYLSWDPGKHFNITLGKGKNFFGEGYRSLFLSDEANSYPYLKITTTVWKIKYVNLFSAMNDIRGAGGVWTDYHVKYTSMHYLSYNMFKRVNIALFEGIVWSQGTTDYPRGFDFNYVNPFVFYRPLEFSQGSPDNALLGGALNFKIGKHNLLYTQLMLDEFLLEQVRNGAGWYANKQAVQAGFVARDAFKVPGLTIRAEWNLARPFIYTHSDTRQNYAHMGQPLAHPYGSSFQEVILHVDRAKGRWRYSSRSSMAWLGQDSTFSHGNNIFRPESDRVTGANGYPQNFSYRIGMTQGYTLLHTELRAGYLVDPNTGTRLEVSYLLRLRTPETGDAAMSNVFRIGVVCYFRDRHPEQEVKYVLR